MDRQDAKPRRPSLLAGAPDPVVPAPSPARILADMAGGQTAGPRAPQDARRGWLLLSVAGLLLASAWLWWAQRGPDDEAPDPTIAQRSATVDATSDARTREARSEPTAATIIDEPAATGVVTATAHKPADGAPPHAASPFALVAVAHPGGADHAEKPATASSAANPFAPPHSASLASLPALGHTQTAPTRVARHIPGGADNGGPALLATLLHNIKANDGPSGLDSLLQKMQANEATGSGRNLDSAAARPRSQQIQANLRECPPPNTTKGLTCRQAICAVYAGRDPACPAL